MPPRFIRAGRVNGGGPRIIGGGGDSPFSIYSDTFDDGTLDIEKWTQSIAGVASITETTSLAFNAPVSGDNGNAWITTLCPVGSSSFSMRVNFESLAVSQAVGQYSQFFIGFTVGAKVVQVGYTGDSATHYGEYVHADGVTTFHSTGVPSAGYLRVVRVGDDFSFIIDGVTVQTETLAGSVSELRIHAFSNGGASTSVNVTQATFAGG